MLGYLSGGTLGPQRETEDIKDEADVLVAQTETSSEFVVANEIMQSDDATLNLLAWLEEAANAQLFRYFLPTQVTTEKQCIFIYNGNVRKDNWTVTTAAGAVRARGFEVVGTADGSGYIYKIITLPTNQADAQWASYAAFKDSAFP